MSIRDNVTLYWLCKSFASFWLGIICAQANHITIF